MNDRQLRADMYIPQLVVGGVGRGLCIDVSRVHDFHGNAANPSLNGTLRHADINHVLSHRAQEKIDKYRAGYAALDVRKAFLPAVVSTSGRIHGDLLRLLYLLADNIFFVFLYLSVCEASRLRSPPYPHSVSVATRSFQ